MFVYLLVVSLVYDQYSSLILYNWTFEDLIVYGLIGILSLAILFMIL